jgi:hypothetical protein
MRRVEMRLRAHEPRGRKRTEAAHFPCRLLPFGSVGGARVCVVTARMLERTAEHWRYCETVLSPFLTTTSERR